jgi:hypothetical protein
VRFPISLGLVALLCWAACGYDDRSFDQVAFACDATHPCPEGRACVAGRCATSDTGSGDGGNGSGSNGGRVGVQCGGALCPLGMGCCNDLVNPLRCVPRGGCDSGAQQELECDGGEDCTGRPCCLNSGGTRCGPAAVCEELEICSSNLDCPAAQSFCCAFPILGVPLKRCQPVACQ